MEIKRIDDEVKNGAVETYYANGQLASRANYKDGERNGLRETWDENGQLWTRTNYKNDKLDGLYEVWYSNGQMMTRTNYKNDKLNGLCEFWGGDGRLWTRENYKDGVLMFTIKHEQNRAEQENDKNASKEESLRLERENLALKIMVLRDRQLSREITFKESLKQSTSLIEEYEKNKIGNYREELL